MSRNFCQWSDGQSGTAVGPTETVVVLHLHQLVSYSSTDLVALNRQLKRLLEKICWKDPGPCPLLAAPLLLQFTKGSKHKWREFHRNETSVSLTVETIFKGELNHLRQVISFFQWTTICTSHNGQSGRTLRVGVGLNLRLYWWAVFSCPLFDGHADRCVWIQNASYL